MKTGLQTNGNLKEEDDRKPVAVEKLDDSIPEKDIDVAPPSLQPAISRSMQPMNKEASTMMRNSLENAVVEPEMMNRDAHETPVDYSKLKGATGTASSKYSSNSKANLNSIFSPRGQKPKIKKLNAASVASMDTSGLSEEDRALKARARPGRERREQSTRAAARAAANPSSEDDLVLPQKRPSSALRRPEQVMENDSSFTSHASLEGPGAYRVGDDDKNEKELADFQTDAEELESSFQKAHIEKHDAEHARDTR